MAESTYLPFWLAGLTLASVPLLHWFALRRGLAVSGRFTALVDRVRHGAPSADSQASDEDLAAALRAMTAETFGADAVEAVPTEPDAAPAAPRPTAEGPAVHALFLVGLVAGGAIAALAAGGLNVTTSLRGEVFGALFGGARWHSAAALFGGGVLVGIGTRMAGGCTSGHGLCGVSRLETGSLVATAAFFGAGVATSFLLGALL